MDRIKNWGVYIRFGNNGLSMDSAITYLVYLINIFSDKIQLSVISSKYNKRIITLKGRYHPRILK